MIPRLTLLIGLLIASAAAPLAVAQSPPDDSGAYHLITVSQAPATPQCVALEKALQSAAMQRIVGSCKTFRFDPSNTLYQERFAQALPAEDAPVVALARPDGGVIYKASGLSIPGAERLASELTRVAQVDQQSFGDRLRPRLIPENRPRLIPDSVVVAPNLNIPPTFVIGVLVILAICALSFVLLGAAALYLMFLR